MCHDGVHLGVQVLELLEIFLGPLDLARISAALHPGASFFWGGGGWGETRWWRSEARRQGKNKERETSHATTRYCPGEPTNKTA